jgi:hypothetical protein
MHSRLFEFLSRQGGIPRGSALSKRCDRTPSRVGTAQLPLYTIWSNGTRLEILFAVIHCTAGDLLITVFALALAALAARIGRWPFFGNRMALTAILLGLGYTVFSEWLNTQVRQSWSYTEAMPLLPPLGTGLTPFLQWLIVPGIALGYVRRKARVSNLIST